MKKMRMNLKNKYHMNRFNLLYEEIIGSIDLDELDKTFEFQMPTNDVVTCEFSIDDDLGVFATVKDGSTSFKISNKLGETKIMSENEFSKTFKDLYQKFVKKLEKFTFKKNLKNKEHAANKITPFDEQLHKFDEKAEEGDVKTTELITMDSGNCYAFDIISDPLVVNHCVCSFKIPDTDEDFDFDFYDYDEKFKNEPKLFKADINLQEENSLILKIAVLNVDGEFIEYVTPSDFEHRWPELFNEFKEALKRMQKIYYKD